MRNSSKAWRRCGSWTTPPTCCSSARPESATPCSPSARPGPARATAEAGHRVYFTTAAELAAKCHKAALEGRWSTCMRFFAGPRLLVIDQLGYLPLPDDGASLLFQVINQRSEVVHDPGREGRHCRLGRRVRRRHRRCGDARPAAAPGRRRRHRRTLIPAARPSRPRRDDPPRSELPCQLTPRLSRCGPARSAAASSHHPPLHRPTHLLLTTLPRHRRQRPRQGQRRRRRSSPGRSRQHHAPDLGSAHHHGIHLDTPGSGTGSEPDRRGG